MKTENTLRTVRNSLLCFFMALGAGLLVACGSSGGGGTSTFPAYLTDAPVEGAEYSSSARPVKAMTEKNGEFEASEGVFEFSVGATTLGSVRLNSDWANSHVTPADFIGVDEAQVITIARILQGLDDPTDDGIISISQSARDLTVDLLADTAFTASLNTSRTVGFTITVNSVTLMVPSENDARNRLIATRQCLYSGGYMGDYRSTVTSDNPKVGRRHFVFLPIFDDNPDEFYIGVDGVEFTISSDGSRGDSERRLFGFVSPLGVTGTVFTSINGDQLTFVTPRSVTGIWTDTNDEDEVTDSGTFRLTRVAGNPTANRRVIGVETEAGSTTPVGIYALDYDGSEFRGQYYDVGTDQYSVMLLTVADGSDPWPAGAGSRATLTLSGTLGGDNTTVTVEVNRETKTDRDASTTGRLRGGVTGDGGNMLKGYWCDLRTTTASVVSGGALVESLAMSHSRIGGDVSAHRLSRYLDSGFPANTAIEGEQILG